MNQLNTQGIVLTRTDYGEADRILTVLTPDHGKLRLMAKGVRRVKSKLAGGIELFSVSAITFIRGRGEIGTLVSARLVRHYGTITSNIEHVQLGYELIKRLNKITEDEPEQAYFDLLEHAFAALDDLSLDEALIRLWFDAQLLRLGGHSPNLETDTSGQKLTPEANYAFDFDAMAFRIKAEGQFAAGHIKFLRLLFGGYTPALLRKVQQCDAFVAICYPLIQAVARQALNV